MDIKTQWSLIRKHFNQAFSSSLHVSIASVNSQNEPTVTPIGSLFLNADLSGFYFEKYPSKLKAHALDNNNICVLAVKSNKPYWIHSLLKGRFASYPGIKLYGQLGERRKATEVELQRLNRRMKATRWLKGNAYLWGDMEEVREVRFVKAEAIQLGKMTSHL